MAEFREALSNILGDLACSSARVTRSLRANVTGTNQTQTQENTENWIYSQERLFCEKDPFAEPFRPGLCAQVYGVTVTYRIDTPAGFAGDGTFTAFATLWGQIGSATVQRTTLQNEDPSDRFEIFIGHYGPGNQARGAFRRERIAGPGACREKSNVTILSVRSEADPGGGAGICPVLPVERPYDPVEYTYPINLPYSPSPGVNITIPLVAVVGIFYVNASGNVIMPVTFNVRPTFNTNIKANFKFQANINLNTGETQVEFEPGAEPNTPPLPLPPASRPPFAPPNRVTPPKPPSIPDLEVEPDEEPPGSKLIGVLVTSEYNDLGKSVSVIPQGDNPDLQVPSIGYVAFAIDAGNGQLGWTSDIPVKNLRAYIPVPFNAVARAVRGTPKAEIAWTLTPIFEQVLQLAGG